jgi:hypothetical protein
VTHEPDTERCTWCGTLVGPDDGYRLVEAPGGGRATFCRLEHAVPWAIRGAHWDAGAAAERPAAAEGSREPAGSVDACARCGEPLRDVHLLLVRHRGEHRIPDGFCSVDHLREWAAAGGRFG